MAHGRRTGSASAGVAGTTMLGAVVRMRLRVLRRHLRLRGRRRRCRSRSRRGGGAAGSGEEGAREPVLLVSGMGGSVLHARRRSDPKFDLRVWVRILLADLEFKKYLWSLYNAQTGGLWLGLAWLPVVVSVHCWCLID